MKPLIISVPAPSAEVLADYVRELRETITEDKVKELEELNDRTFNSKYPVDC